MMSLISGPCCDSDIEPDPYKSFAWERHVRLQIYIVFEETKSSLASIKYILKIINVCQDNVKHGKNCTDERFYF